MTEGHEIPQPNTARTRLGAVVFFLIAFGVPWAGFIIVRKTVGLNHLFDSPAFYWFTAAPSFAGFVAAAVEGGAAGFRRFVARVFNLRFALWIWPLALLLPCVAALLSFAPHSADLWHGGAPKFAAVLATASLMNFFTGPIAEEFGWRGYLLGLFCRRWSPLAAGLAIGPIWVLWHLPLFYDSVFAHWSSTLGYLAWTTAWSVVLALIVARAKGSVLPSILGHWSMNAQPGIFFALLPLVPGERQPGGVAFAVASVAVAIVVALLWRRVKWQAPA